MSLSEALSSVKSRFGNIIRNAEPTAEAWRGVRRGLMALIVLEVAAAGFFLVETGNMFEGWLGMLTAFGALLVVALIISALFGTLGKLPKFTRVVVILAILTGLGYGLILWGLPGALIPAILLVIFVSMIAGSLTSLHARGLSIQNGLAVVTLAIGVVGLGGGVALFLQPVANPNSWLEDVITQDQTLDLPDPGQPGNYSVDAFTYGSGIDLQRSEYAANVRFRTDSVDGSNLVSGWDGVVGRTRTSFWGFDQSALPIQGYVWMPEGEGPFPLILMVHGGHPMEDFSESGYEYLGEHFASRGIIAVSVDQNFLNPSVSGLRNPMAAGIGPENDARGWILLKHLEQWRAWNSDAAHPLAGKVDMDRVALMGHSRGGDAVSIAASFNNLDHYPDNAAERFDFHFGLKGIIAVGTIDGQYQPRGSKNELRDISYFTISGSMDSDMESFMGLSQMSRVELSGEIPAIKASLYVEGANHGQFNTVWGWADRGLPFSWGLNRNGFMKAEDQRQIAKVYFSAFLDSVLYDRKRYLPLLGDPQKGAAWLPEHYMLANLVTSDRQVIANFEEDMEVSSGSLPATHIRSENLTRWSEQWIRLKWAPLDTHATMIAWDNQFEAEEAVYELTWLPGSLNLDQESALVFAASDAGGSTKPFGWTPAVDAPSDSSEQPPAASDAIKPVSGLDWTVILTDIEGNEAGLPLSHDSPLYPQIKAAKRKFEGLAAIDKSEIVWRRFEFPIKDFLMVNSDLQVEAITGLRFQFDRSGAGSVVLDDFGFE